MKTLTFRVTDDEARLIRSLAKREHLTVSEYLRRRARDRSRAARLPGKVRCEFTGAMIFAPLPDLSPMDTKSVRETLTNFP